jgi:leader peptidase (prepilin peptidase)/N-methyltransferase
VRRAIELAPQSADARELAAAVRVDSPVASAPTDPIATPTMLFVLVFVLGAIVGSFLNVCIHRLPSDESIVFPASHCPRCRKPIRPYDNIPIVSYVLLRGRCRRCAAPISIRYPVVEMLAGLAAVATVHALGVSAEALLAFAFVCALIVVTFVDFDHQIIPDSVSLPGIGVGLAAAIIFGHPSWTASLAGIVVGGGLLWAVAEAYYRLTGREGMGGGDIKLLAMIGAFLGWQAVLVTLMIGSLTGSLIGILLMIVQRGDRRTAIPFGPFLAVGAVAALFWGDALIGWYLGITQPPA